MIFPRGPRTQEDIDRMDEDYKIINPVSQLILRAVARGTEIQIREETWLVKFFPFLQRKVVLGSRRAQQTE